MTASTNSAAPAASGALFALGAYGIWGIAPLYFRWLDGIGSVEIVVHRVLWTALLLLPLLLMLGGGERLRAVLRDRYRLSRLALSGILIGFNWLLFIYCIETERILEASLGYYINPLISLVLGMLVLGERMRPVQWIAVTLAVLGVANEIVRFGSLPWLGLALALSFGVYGLVRKQLGVDSMTGLTVESWLLLPIALPWLLWHGVVADDAFTASPGNALKLVLAGPVTMVPLLCFAAAASRLALGTLGFFQYIAPSLQFGLAVLVFGEPFVATQWFTFIPIWLALCIFSGDVLLRQRRKPPFEQVTGPTAPRLEEGIGVVEGTRR